jgi:hypothetical protein
MTENPNALAALSGVWLCFEYQRTSRKLKGKAMSEPNGDVAIDERVCRLVEVLNELPGIDTFSSCGGHDDHEHGGRCPADEFYVNFRVDVVRGGMAGLAVIAFAAGACENVGVNVWCNTADPADAIETLSFEIRGVEGTEPGELADCINNALADYGRESDSQDDESNADWRATDDRR